LNETKKALFAGAALAALAGTAAAQSLETSASELNAPYGRYNGQENRPISPSTRDANGNRVIVDGIMQIGSDQSVFARTGAWGAADSYAGAGAVGGATAIGNNLVVITQGSWNTVIVNSTQINTGDVTAGTVLNGQIDLDDED